MNPRERFAGYVLALGFVVLGCTDKSSAAPSAPEAKPCAAAPPSVAPVASDAAPTPRPAPSAADAAAPVSPAATPVADFSNVERAMGFFVQALQARNPDALLQCFSRKKGFLLTGTSDTPHDSMRFSYAKLEQGLKPGGDFVGILLGGEGDDNFRDYVVQTQGAAWKNKGPATFVPPNEHSLPVFVRWKKEGKRFVVEQIAFPAG